MRNILITGYSGFVGSALLEPLKGNCHLRLLGRKPSSEGKVYTHDINSNSIYTAALDGVETLIHCAARVHLMQDDSVNPLSEYREINTQGTLNLALQAAKAGVKRFIFLSSIKVNGESTTGADPFSELDLFIPNDPYGLSKFEAEKGLLNIASKTGMDVVIIRSPLVYGPEVKGNLVSVIHAIKKNYPLPLGLVKKNKRSLIALENLIDFILLCADNKKTPRAANQIFLISDGEDVSTTELFQRVAKAYGKKSILFPVSPSLLSLGAKLLGKRGAADRLLGSLQVDSSKARELLGWKPVVTMDEQLRKMAEAEGYPK